MGMDEAFVFGKPYAYAIDWFWRANLSTATCGHTNIWLVRYAIAEAYVAHGA